MKEQKDAAKEALDSATLAQFHLVQVGGKQERFFRRLEFQGMMATAWRVEWIQALSRNPQ